MEVMFLLIGASLLFALTFLGIFLFAVKRGQFEDLHTPAVKILLDVDVQKKKGDKKW